MAKTQAAATDTVAETPVKTFELSDFFTSAAIQKGKKLPLTLPDGTETPHYLIVTSIDAPAVRRTMLENARSMSKLDHEKLSSEELSDIQQKNTVNTRAEMVIGWSFDIPFSKEAVIGLLKENSMIAEAVDVLGSNPSRFFAKDSTSS